MKPLLWPANVFRKYSASNGMSSVLSRRAGMWMRTTEIRKYKSSRKGAFLHHFFEVAAGGANDPHIDGMRGIRAQAFQTAFLQHAQKLGLLGHRQVANFVEKNGPTPGLFEASAARLDGAGKSAFFVTEKFVFNQRFRQGTGGEGNEGLLRARTQVMNGAGHNALSRPALTCDEHAGKNL